MPSYSPLPKGGLCHLTPLYQRGGYAILPPFTKGGDGGISILRCARAGHGGYQTNTRHVSAGRPILLRHITPSPSCLPLEGGETQYFPSPSGGGPGWGWGKKVICRSRIKHLTKNGAYLIRRGRRHSIYQRKEYRTEVPRHTEIVDELARKICKDLNIPFVR